MPVEKEMDERQKQLYYRYHYHAFYMLAGLCIVLAVLYLGLRKFIFDSEVYFGYLILFSPLLPCGYLFFREAKSQLLTQRDCKQNCLFSFLWLILIFLSDKMLWLRIAALLYCIFFVGINIWALCRLKKTSDAEEKELIKISSGNREKYCTEWKEAKTFLKRCCRRGQPQEIMLSGTDTTEQLKLFYTAKGICVQFFEDGEKQGFQAVTKAGGKGSMGYVRGVKTFFAATALLPVHQAFRCAKGFFETKSLPDVGEWHEI